MCEVKTKLKPVYESVAAGDVKAGDVVKDDLGWGEPYEVAAIAEKDRALIRLLEEIGIDDFNPEEEVLRKLPDRRHPEVLMRALRISIAEDLLCEDFRDGYMHGHPDKERREVEIATRVNEAIDAALKEIESEGVK